MNFNKPMFNIVFLLGTSGSGKSYLANALDGLTINNKNFRKLIQVTTRKRRNEEIGKPEIETYRFITEKEYNDYYKDKLIAKIRHYSGGKYGTLLPDEIEMNDDNIFLVIVNKDGLNDALNTLKNKDILFDYLLVIIHTKDENDIRDNRDKNKEIDEINEIKNIYNDDYILEIVKNEYNVINTGKDIVKKLFII